MRRLPGVSDEVDGSLIFETVICDPFCSFSKLLLATTSPGLMPCDRGLAPIRLARLDCPHRRFVVLDEVDKVLVSVVLDGRRRDDNLVLEGLHQKTRIHKLVRKQLPSRLSNSARSLTVPVVVSI